MTRTEIVCSSPATGPRQTSCALKHSKHMSSHTVNNCRALECHLIMGDLTHRCPCSLHRPKLSSHAALKWILPGKEDEAGPLGLETNCGRTEAGWD